MHYVYTDDLQGISLLLVEDNAIMAIDVTGLIEMAGGRVVGPAYSLSQGFRWIENGRFDCALLDISLHGDLVFQLADAIVERSIPVVFLSAHSLNIAPLHHRQRRFIHKPFSSITLIQAIRAAVSEARGTPSALAQSALVGKVGASKP
jgi:DNA-binding response OmpR family regulator